MPFYRYRGKDPAGRLQEGTLEAADPNAAVAALRSKGWQVLGLDDAKKSASAPPISMPQAQPQPTVHKTRWGRDKDIHFMFTQVGGYLRAGVNPAQAFEQLGNSWGNTRYRDALLDVGRSAIEGRRISDVLERYPYLFPPHVVGIFRVGETSGQMPEACDRIAQQAFDSHRFRKVFWWLGITAIGLVFFFPLGLLMVRSMLDMWHSLEGNANQSGVLVLFRMIAQQLIWPMGPAVLATLVLYWLFKRWWLAMPARELRHKMVLKLPTIGRRAWAESLGLFSWALALLSRTGLSPMDCLLGATQAMPNLSLKAQMQEVGSKMTDKTKISEATAGLRLVPPEFVPMVSTGEMVGDISGQMAAVVQSTREEFEHHERFMRTRLGCWVVLLSAFGVLILMYLLYSVFYGQLFRDLDAEGMGLLNMAAATPPWR